MTRYLFIRAEGPLAAAIHRQLRIQFGSVPLPHVVCGDWDDLTEFAATIRDSSDNDIQVICCLASPISDDSQRRIDEFLAELAPLAARHVSFLPLVVPGSLAELKPLCTLAAPRVILAARPFVVTRVRADGTALDTEDIALLVSLLLWLLDPAGAGVGGIHGLEPAETCSAIACLTIALPYARLTTDAFNQRMAAFRAKTIGTGDEAPIQIDLHLPELGLEDGLHMPEVNPFKNATADNQEHRTSTESWTTHFHEIEQDFLRTAAAGAQEQIEDMIHKNRVRMVESSRSQVNEIEEQVWQNLSGGQGSISAALRSLRRLAESVAKEKDAHLRWLSTGRRSLSSIVGEEVNRLGSAFAGNLGVATLAFVRAKRWRSYLALGAGLLVLFSMGMLLLMQRMHLEWPSLAERVYLALAGGLGLAGIGTYAWRRFRIGRAREQVNDLLGQLSDQWAIATKRVRREWTEEAVGRILRSVLVKMSYYEISALRELADRIGLYQSALTQFSPESLLPNARHIEELLEVSPDRMRAAREALARNEKVLKTDRLFAGFRETKTEAQILSILESEFWTFAQSAWEQPPENIKILCKDLLPSKVPPSGTVGDLLRRKIPLPLNPDVSPKGTVAVYARVPLRGTGGLATSEHAPSIWSIYLCGIYHGIKLDEVREW